MKIGIIGTADFTKFLDFMPDSSMLETEVREVKVGTQRSSVSQNRVLIKTPGAEDVEAIFVYRQGENDSIPIGEVNHLANMQALKYFDPDLVFGLGTATTLEPYSLQGNFVVPSQLVNMHVITPSYKRLSDHETSSFPIPIPVPICKPLRKFVARESYTMQKNGLVKRAAETIEQLVMSFAAFTVDPHPLDRPKTRVVYVNLPENVELNSEDARLINSGYFLGLVGSDFVEAFPAAELGLCYVPLAFVHGARVLPSFNQPEPKDVLSAIVRATIGYDSKCACKGSYADLIKS
ncbi:hypothetical protein HN587_07195 [Candidatus Woesearchaeota archaeon]|jgi:hypothetical protein|nr:hypothetical protein [Candidatus Woesearchaeota archaeon]